MKKTWMFSILVLLIVSGCTTTQKGAAVGGGTGAVLGGVIGHQSGHGTEGALIGAGLGAAAGALAGEKMDTKFCPTCGKTYTGGTKYCPVDGMELKVRQQ